MKQKTIQPLGENILVEPLKSDKEKTKTGIYLPENAAEEKPQEGKVIAIGESKEIKVKKGQTVIYNRYGGTEVKVGEKAYLIVKNEDVLAVME